MKAIKYILLLSLFLTGSISAQQLNSTTITNAIRTSFASEKITVDATAGGVRFTAATINPTCTDCVPGTNNRATGASCSLETGDIRILTSGTVTASTGLYITAGSSFTLYGYTDINAFRAIRVTATSGTINCIYYR